MKRSCQIRPGDIVIGVDVGTTNVKAVAYGASGQSLAKASTPTPWQGSDRGHNAVAGREMDPGVLWSVVRTAIDRIADGRRVLALGVTGMAESGVLVDSQGKAMNPIIGWSDGRGDAQLALLKATIGSAFTQMTGLPFTVRPTAVKVRAILDARGERRTKARWMTVPEWIVACAGGDPKPEFSLASRTGWLDLAQRDWATDLLRFSGLGPQPSPQRAGTPMGTVRGGAAVGATLTVAGHDHLCAAIGAGASQPGILFDSWGTGEALLQSLKTLPSPEHIQQIVNDGASVGLHADHQLPTVFLGLGSGIALRETLGELLVPQEQIEALTLKALAHDLARADHVSEPAVRQWHEALISVFDRFNAGLLTMREVAGTPRTVVSAGGWLRVTSLVALRERHTEPFVVCPIPEPGAFGAAHLAARAADLAPFVNSDNYLETGEKL